MDAGVDPILMAILFGGEEKQIKMARAISDILQKNTASFWIDCRGESIIFLAKKAVG